MSTSLSAAEERMGRSVGWEPPAVGYAWTKEQVEVPLRAARFVDLVEDITERVSKTRLVMPDSERFIRRVVTAVLSGHVVLQGPPGTGKTTFARILSDAFDVDLRITTATAEWSTYDVLGGLRPSPDGGLEPVLGAVSEAALACARQVKVTADGGNPFERQATWLLIDELNRADIDKAIGSLYTVLSSIASDHLRAVPLELWFERSGRRHLWLPSRFRIIGTMNDVDTSYVNTLSQGLTRRFQFVTLGVSLDSEEQSREVRSTFDQAIHWVSEQHSTQVPDASLIYAAQQSVVELLQKLVAFVRDPAGVSWPLGSAQLLSVWRTVLISLPDLTHPVVFAHLDEAIADLIIPQASALAEESLTKFGEYTGSVGLELSRRAIHHLLNTTSTF